jgi:hypothetical protein
MLCSAKREMFRRAKREIRLRRVKCSAEQSVKEENRQRFSIEFVLN